jgi:hypothetical protein
MLRVGIVTASLAALALAGCGGGDESEDRQPEPRQAAGADLGAIKSYLLDHTQALQRESASLRRDAEAYHGLARSVGFDADRLIGERRAEARELVERMQATFRRANPAYEETEGVVAGVPELADFDVILDAGGDKSDPENAVPFSVRTPAGRTFEQPGNFFFLLETSLWGTEPRFTARGVKPDLDGDGRVRFGEALPDADFLVAAVRDFDRNVRELGAAAREWQPTAQDAFTALVVMTPTMSEYFEAWKSSRFVAGADATESGFVAVSRLQDIADILGGLVTIYDNVQGSVARVDAAQARQIGRELKGLRDYAARLQAEEAAGRRFSAQDADTLGSEAQDRAEAIAGQVSQAAGRMGIELEA